MLSNGDQYIYDESMQDKKIKYPVLRKSLKYQTDSNNGNYQTSSLTFDLSQLANIQGELLDYSNAELVLPLIYTLQGPTGVVGGVDGMWDYRLGPKNGAWNLIHSASISVGNREVLSPSASFLNEIISFRVLTQWDASTINSYGVQCLWALDDCNSWQWLTQDVADTSANKSRLLAGNSIVNNWVLPTYNSNERFLLATNPATGPVGLASANRYYINSSDADVPFGNKGLEARMKMINNKIKVLSAPTQNVASVFAQNADLLRGKTVYDNELKNYTTEMINSAGNNSYQFYVVTASIPLKVICPFFEALSLSRSLYVKAVFQLNTGYVAINTPATAANTGAQYTTSPNIGFQNTCPIQIAPKLLGAATDATTHINHAVTCTALLATVNLVTPYSCNVSALINGGSIPFTNPVSQATQVRHPLGSARIVVPCYELSPDDAADYLSRNTAKTIEYENYSTNYLTNVAPNNMVDYMISNGSVGVTAVLVIPHISASQNINSDTYNGGLPITGFTDARSPFAAATPSPAASYYNCQVLLGGRNIISGQGDTPLVYNNDVFMQELRSVGKINGGFLVGLSTGMGLSLKQWSDCYRYMYAVNRDPDAKSPVSVQVKFTNASSATHDYLMVLFRKQSMTINMANGQIIE